MKNNQTHQHQLHLEINVHTHGKRVLTITFLLLLLTMKQMNAQDVESFSTTPLFSTTRVSHGYDIIQTADSNFIVCGSVGTSPKEMLIVKYDQHGDTLWKYTRKGSYDQEAYSIREIEEDIYIIGGYIRNAYGHSDFIVLKLSDGGTSLTENWYYTYGNSSSEEACNSLITTNEGGFLAVGSSNYTNDAGDFFAVKMKSDGSHEWYGYYGGSGHDAAYSVCQLRDSTYMICGTTESFGASDRDVYLVHIDKAGDTLSTNIYTNDGIDEAYSIYTCEESGFVIAGCTDKGGSNNKDMMLMKIYDDSTLIWRKTYGGGGDEIAYSVKETKNYGFTLAGSTTENEAEQGTSLLLVTTDDYGDSLQGSTYGDAYFDEARAVCVTGDNTLVMTGTTSTNTVSTLALVSSIGCPAYFPRGIWFGGCWEFDANETVYKKRATMLIDDDINGWDVKMQNFIDYCVHIKAHTVVLNNLEDIFRIQNTWSGGAFSNFPANPGSLACPCYPSYANYLLSGEGDTLRNRLKTLVSNLHLAGVPVVLAQWLDQERNPGESPYKVNDGLLCSGNSACDFSSNYTPDETSMSITNSHQILDAFITFNSTTIGLPGEQFNGLMLDYEYFSPHYGDDGTSWSYNYEFAYAGCLNWMTLIDEFNAAKLSGISGGNNGIKIVQAYMNYICFTDFNQLNTTFSFDYNQNHNGKEGADTQAEIDDIDSKHLDAIVLAFPITDNMYLNPGWGNNDNPIYFLLGEPHTNTTPTVNSLLRHRLIYFGNDANNIKTSIIPWFRSVNQTTCNTGDVKLGNYLLGNCDPWTGTPHSLADAENEFVNQFVTYNSAIPPYDYDPAGGYGDVNIYKGFMWFQYGDDNYLQATSFNQIPNRPDDAIQSAICQDAARLMSSSSNDQHAYIVSRSNSKNTIESVQIIPNPFNSSAKVFFPDGYFTEVNQLKIKDALGRDVTRNFKFEQYKSNEIKIISNFKSDGIYFLELSGNNDQKVFCKFSVTQ